MPKSQSKSNSTYKVDWFSEHIPRWKQHLSVYARPNTRALMLGVYEGMCISWLLDNILTGPGASVVVIDGFEYDPCVYYRSRPVWNPEVRKTFENNVLRKPSYAAKTTVFNGTLRKLSCRADQQRRYDIIYIDAKSSAHALDALVTAFPMLNLGGMLVVQNYANNVEHDNACPAQGIDAFLSTYADNLEVVSKTFHLFARRKLHVVEDGHKPCHIEGYSVPVHVRPQCPEARRNARARPV